MYLAYILLIIYTTGVVNSGQNKLQCKDEAGNDGLAYLYITSDTVANGWQLSKKEIGSKDSVPGKTLSSLYKDDLATDILWILYNDQAPNKNQSSVRYGHTKGVLMTDNTRGFWLIHSMNAVGLQLMYNQIMTYRYNLPEVMVNEYPSLVNASKHVRPKKAPYFHKEEILYDDLIAPELKSDLLAETWLNGRGKLPSECSGSKVQNVQSIVLNAANVDFKSSRDHSKWAVTQTNKKNRNWVCIGDINRANTQFNRGGGAVCVNLPQLWTNYRGSVNEVEPCPKKKKGFFGGVKDFIFSWFS
ncbi:Similar to DNASE2: Deoxyribonuclease-2-alpha (Homo sapiens) [Cotesia congregata]|uniref:Similar to DNASE2: Deoxyribonuclease-2-alpha (Homo sapiens) n=1 Tax=Cotesia congregata TaxID=51543 RepID=A0A8J2HFR8_COTCN|nr:Similar to DNASE2: Deoxyribonuclease-2-alpha (Homo sapiens) [Cotesia congregata]